MTTLVLREENSRAVSGADVFGGAGYEGEFSGDGVLCGEEGKDARF
jgi:hypothetical protein